VAVTVFVAVSITETLLLSELVTYTFPCVIATPFGSIPTVTVAVTRFVAVSITDTVPSTEFGTYANDTLSDSLCAADTNSVAEKTIKKLKKNG
jgi:hypothetical protein